MTTGVAAIVRRCLRIFLGLAAVCLAGASVAPCVSAQISSEGSSGTITHIYFEGNRRIQRATLLARMFSREHDPYNEESVRRDFIALWNTQYFEDIRLEVEDDPQVPGGKILRFFVTERPVIRRIEYKGNKSVSESDILDRFKERKVGLTVESRFDPTVIKHAQVVLQQLLAESLLLSLAGAALGFLFALGVAKAAVLTHRNMVANVLQASAWINPSLKANEARIVITALPLYHIFALTSNCLAFLSLGARNVLITNPRDFKSFVAELKKFKFNFISGVNTLFNALLHTPGFETVDFSALRVTFAGGMALQSVVAARWKQVTGCIVTQGWGLTETSPIATANPTGLDFNGSVGLPIPSTDISIRDDAGAERGGGAEIAVERELRRHGGAPPGRWRRLRLATLRGRANPKRRDGTVRITEDLRIVPSKSANFARDRERTRSFGPASCLSPPH